MTLSHKPRLTIGLPVYNGGRFLAQAIDSLVNQTFTDFRLIISDNASTDGTSEICRRYQSRDSRIVYHRAPENRGPIWNLNHVAKLADSAYFKWAAHDDICAPEYLERCVEVLDHRPRVILCYTKSRIIDEQGAAVSPYDNPVNATAPSPYDRFRDVVLNLGLCHLMFGVMRLDVLRRTRFLGSYPTADMTLIAELALHGEFCEVAEPLFLRRAHPGQPHRVYHNPAEYMAWLSPGNHGPVWSLSWTRLSGHLRAIAHAPVELDQKLRCAFFLVTHPLPRWPSRPQAV